jgi:Amt family ammonium transporter
MEARVAALESLVNSLTTQLSDSRRLSHAGEDFGRSAFGTDFMGYELDTGNTAWVLASTALVLFMTMPGLGLYYCGMVRVENVLTTVMQTLSITCLITVCWLAFGYSLSFGPANVNMHGNPYYGDSSRIWLQGMRYDSVHQLATTIPEPIFCVYQLTFAIITSALICGSFADRMKYWPMMLFMFLWHWIVYCPIAHWNWHPNGWLFKLGAIDFAGGNVVHIASGMAGLASVIIVGNRRGFLKKEFKPHNILLTFIGTGMLWVGWFGFNGGSALAADGRASNAILVTHICASTAALSWSIFECIWKRQATPTVLGMLSGAVSGLVIATPGSGFIDQTGAFVLGLLGGPFCFLGSQLKHYMGFDDALDAFGVHAIGGMFGGIGVAFFANNVVYHAYKGVYYAGLEVGGKQLAYQIAGILATGGWSFFASIVILVTIDKTIGLRVSAEDEDGGLDKSIHGETIVNVEGDKTVEMTTTTVAIEK